MLSQTHHHSEKCSNVLRFMVILAYTNKLSLYASKSHQLWKMLLDTEHNYSCSIDHIRRQHNFLHLKKDVKLIVCTECKASFFRLIEIIHVIFP